MEISNKILMIAATPFFSDRGCHIRIYNEIKYLNKNNIDVVLCTYHLGYNPTGIKSENIKRIVNVSWYQKITPGASWGKIYLDFLLLILSFKEYLKIKPRIIHAHLYEGLFIAWLVKIVTFSKIKIIFDCQGSLAEEMKAYTLHKSFIFKPFYYFFMLVEKMLLYIPNKIVCSSKNSYNFLQGKYNVSENKIDVLNDSVDDDIFQPITQEEKKQARKKYSIDHDKIVIVYTGSMTKAKGVDGLLEAVPHITKKNKKIVFVFAGYGDLEGEYRLKYSELVKSGSVIFISRFSYFELPNILALGDFGIDPKKNSSESSGKLYNYLSCGLNVFCFKHRGFSIKGRFIYINNFNDLTEIVPSHNDFLNEKQIGWKFIINNLINNYKC